MKSKIFFLNLIFCLFYISCKEPIVTFEVAQPENVKEQKEFPKKLIGTYYNSENDSELIIRKYFIFKKMLIKDTLRISELNKNEIIKNDTLYKLNSNEKYKIIKINDSLFSNYVYSDTIFNLKKSDALKKFKGYYFLNKLIENTGFWEVEKLNLTKGILNINGIETENEISLLENITESKKDTVKPFTIKPTKKQFKEFIKKNGFSNGEVYVKQ
ncbi:hypothetical protein [Flavobacterium sp. N2270]|uniref:hypothetical protein n=1 Tax=Flavobacterium sp. N2270 TaxID=2986831 RepID=UPI002224DE2F|nr:hypothetical protein [Flavobacterium sp. N2270]